MAGHASTGGTDIDDNEEWELVSEPEYSDVNDKPTSSTYMEFQLKSKLLRLDYSFKFQSLARSTSGLRHIGPKETNMLHPQEQSPLFRLPAEIRLHIYELVFRVPQKGQGVVLRRLCAGEHCNHPRSVLTSLLSCRRFLDEAEEIFYSMNRLFVEKAFWASIGPRRRDAITRITVAESIHSLPNAPNLKSLYIVRRLSVKYINPHWWAAMAPQLIAEIEKMESLEEIKIFTPNAKDLNEHEIARQRRLNEIDRRICGAVKSARAPVGTA